MEETKIITFLNNKGGVGKTTLTIMVAEALKEFGYSVLMVDADPQRSLSNWANRRDAELPIIGADQERMIKSGINAIKDKFDFVIIDCKPTLATQAIVISDLVVLPVVASLFDCEASNNIEMLLLERQRITNGKPKGCFVINRLKRTNTRCYKLAKQELQNRGLIFIDTPIIDRDCYIHCLPTGHSVYTIEDKHLYKEAKKARKEINIITKNFLNILEISQ